MIVWEEFGARYYIKYNELTLEVFTGIIIPFSILSQPTHILFLLQQRMHVTIRQKQILVLQSLRIITCLLAEEGGMATEGIRNYYKIKIYSTKMHHHHYTLH